MCRWRRWCPKRQRLHCWLGRRLSVAVGFASAAANGGGAFGENTVATGLNSVALGSGPLSVVTTDANETLAKFLISNLIPAVTTPCQELVAGALQCGTNSQAS